MPRSAIPFLVLFILSGCSLHFPDHEEFLQVKSRAEIRRKLGEPVAIHEYSYWPDVVSFWEAASGNLAVYQFETWVYESTNLADSRSIQELGKTLFSFYVNKKDSGDLIQDINWLSNSVYRKHFQ